MRHPYPGTRPFKADESEVFFGRKGEILDLRDLLVSQRAVLLHAQSGAGKTSLINAGVLPRLPKEWHVVRARVGGSPPGDGASRAPNNVFTANVLSTSLAGSGASPPPTAGLAYLLSNRPSDQTVLLLLDQFEEFFTTNLDHWKDREAFFQDLAATLVVQDPESGPPRPSNLRLLIVIREEHVARLDAFSRYLPDSLRVRYYLERLREASAIEAIVEPAKAFGRPFSPDAAEIIVQKLLQETLYIDTSPGQTPGGFIEFALVRLVRPFFPGVAEKIAQKLLRKTLHTDTRLSPIFGEFVEPTLLQLVCRQLWDRLEPAGDRDGISAEDVGRFGQIDDTLQAYYERTVAEVARETGLREGRLRDWFDRELITVLGTRGRALVGKSLDVRMRAAVRAFEEKHIVREEEYASAEWCELNHDRFIAPIRASNLRWWAKRRSRFAWIGVAILVLLAVIVGLTLGLYRGKVDLQKELIRAYKNSEGETQSAAYTLLAWQGLNQGDWTGAIAAADKCIRDFGAEARAQQREWVKAGDPAPPVDRQSPADARRIGARRILNNVAACLFVKAKAAEHAGRYQEARAAYQMLQEFPYARVWDPGGFFWSPSAGAAEALRTLPQ